MKYIDAELLREKIAEQMESLPREVGRGAGTITSKGYGMMQAFQIMRSIIDTLQKEQPIDKNILTWRDVNELERIINKVHYEFPHGIGEEAFGKLVLERFIDGKDDVQEQPGVDLEKFDKEVTKIWGRCAVESNDSIACLHIDSFIEVARHFFNLGLNARKEK